MAPFLMAFAPASPGKPHPAPWKPANGGLAIDINAELFLPAACKLEHLDRLNTICSRSTETKGGIQFVCPNNFVGTLQCRSDDRAATGTMANGDLRPPANTAA